jgi:putative transposase
LNEHETPSRIAEVCRRHGSTSAIFKKWKLKLCGMPVSEVKRVRVPEDENAELKGYQLLAKQRREFTADR